MVTPAQMDALLVDGQVVDEQTNFVRLETLLLQIQHRLEAEKQRVSTEISNYPPPIPACDDQFNSLLEARSTILQQMGQVRAIVAQSATGKLSDDTIAWLTEQMHTSHILDRTLKDEIRQLLVALTDIA